LKLGLFLPHVSPAPLVSAGKFHPEILTVPLGGSIKEGRAGKTSHFSSFMRQYLENGKIMLCQYLLLMTNKKLHNALSIGTKIDELGGP